MRAKEKNWARNSLLISLVIHAIFFIFLALYVTGTVTKVQELVNAAFVSEPKSQKYKPRPQPVRPIMRPSAPRTQVVDTDIIPVDTPERSSPIPGGSTRTAALPRFSDEAMQNAGSPSALTRNKIVPRVMTTAEVMPSDLTLPASVAGSASGPGGIVNSPGTGGTGTGGSGGGHGRAVLAAMKSPPGTQSLSMIDGHAALDMGDELADVTQRVTLGKGRVPPLPKGELGGIVVGRGKDIEGHIRLIRVKHSLADWWADPSAMPAVMYWMNGQTNVRAEMSTEGGSVTLDHPKLMKCPLAIMTGHDRYLLLRVASQGGFRMHYRHEFTDAERAGLREYLIEAGGLLFFDSCGHDTMLTRLVKTELRRTLPEHSIDRIPNNHELYNCYYDLGGPPPGAYKFWKHRLSAQPVKVRRNLEGLSINGRLAAIVSDRDYLCAARTVNRFNHGDTGEESPASYRFLTNVIIYALTRGGISDHAGYAPEITDADRISIDSPVPTPILMPE